MTGSGRDLTERFRHLEDRSCRLVPASLPQLLDDTCPFCRLTRDIDEKRLPELGHNPAPVVLTRP
jgi:hypothetical protein